MGIVHIPAMFLVFIVINVLGLVIHSCTGNAPETTKEIFTERLVLEEGVCISNMFHRLLICHG